MADRIVILKAGVVQQVGTPQQVYNEPANQFVAGFIGSPTMNFYAARADAGALVLAEGTRLPLDAARAARVRDGAALQLGVRPEHLQLLSDADAALRPALHVQVTVVEPLGSDTLIYFDHAGSRHVARVAPECTPQPGERVRLGVAVERAHLFDADSGAALR